MGQTDFLHLLDSRYTISLDVTSLHPYFRRGAFRWRQRRWPFANIYDPVGQTNNRLWAPSSGQNHYLMQER